MLEARGDTGFWMLKLRSSSCLSSSFPNQTLNSSSLVLDLLAAAYMQNRSGRCRREDRISIPLLTLEV